MTRARHGEVRLAMAGQGMAGRAERARLRHAPPRLASRRARAADPTCPAINADARR